MDYFDGSPEAAAESNQDRTQTALRISWRSGKCSEHLHKMQGASDNAGFSYYNAATKTAERWELFPFVLLGTAFKLSGAMGRFAYSNAVRNLATEPFAAVVRNLTTGDNVKQPPALWRDIKAQQGCPVKLRLVLYVYDIVGERIVEIDGGAVYNAAIEAAYAVFNNGTQKPLIYLTSFESDKFLGFEPSGELSIFALNKFVVEPYHKQKGDVYFAPKYRCGLLRSEKKPELYDAVVAARKTIREYLATDATATTATTDTVTVTAAKPLPNADDFSINNDEVDDLPF